VLVKKSYGDKLKRHKLRNWKLQELDKEMDTVPAAHNGDYIEFLENLEEDENLRQNVNIYFGEWCYCSTCTLDVHAH
jgi:nonsense-mediated mRNA decay protein 3